MSDFGSILQHLMEEETCLFDIYYLSEESSLFDFFEYFAKLYRRAKSQIDFLHVIYYNIPRNKVSCCIEESSRFAIFLRGRRK